jgi:Neprosin
LAIAAVVGVLAPAVGQAAETSPALYDCRPRDPKAADPPPQPVLPPEVAASMQAAIASDEFKAVCPDGEVPEPTGTPQFSKMAPPSTAVVKSEKMAGAGRAQASRQRAWSGRKRGKRTSGATISERVLNEGAWYSWSIGTQEHKASKGINGLFVQQTNEQPYIPTAESEHGSHSLGQLWAIRRIDGGCFSSVETGWSESLGQFGDVSPHLFVFAFDCAVPLGYSSAGHNWVQSSGVTFPNQKLTHNDAFHVYGARMDGNNWWIYYDGQWVGYIPHSSWKYVFPNVLNETLAGGEVATTDNYSTCADMGYAGLFGGNPGAAMFSSVWYEYNYNTQSALTDLYSFSNDPSYYATGNWSSPPNHGYAFRYGGPGWC